MPNDSAAVPATRRRVPERVLAALQLARKRASFEDVVFGQPGEQAQLRSASGASCGPSKPLTQFIVDRTRDFRETYLLPALDELLAWADGGELPR